MGTNGITPATGAPGMHLGMGMAAGAAACLSAGMQQQVTSCVKCPHGSRWLRAKAMQCLQSLAFDSLQVAKLKSYVCDDAGSDPNGHAHHKQREPL